MMAAAVVVDAAAAVVSVMVAEYNKIVRNKAQSIAILSASLSL